MKLLFDQNISFRLKKYLSEYFLECLHVSDVNLGDNKEKDIFDHAGSNELTIVICDSDFEDISS